MTELVKNPNRNYADKPEDTELTKCSICGKLPYIEKMGRPHRRFDSSGNLICGRCYGRALWKKRIPIGVRCLRCGSHETTLTKYGTPRWAKYGDGYLCWSCYTIKNNTGKIFSPERKSNISNGIRRALDAGAVMGPKVHVMDESVFDTIDEYSAYWGGWLIADGCVYIGKRGNPRIELTLSKKDRPHLVKFKNFLKCTNPILPKIVTLNGKRIVQYSLRFSSKKIGGILIRFGVTPRKSHTAKIIGLENDRHFWRAVFEGDGYIKNRDGKDGDRVVVVGSYDLMHQFKDFIERNIPGADVTIKQDKKYFRLYVYSYTARCLVELLYSDISIALDRKLAKAEDMISYI